MRIIAGDKRWLALVGLALGGLAVVYAVDGPWRDASLRDPLATGVIRIGYAVEAPYAFVTPAGEVTGESPEIAKAMAARLGIKHIRWRLVDFGALIAELEARRIDVIAAGMFITPDRARRVNFSLPTFHVRQGLLVPRGNPRRLSSYRQAAGMGDIRLAALAGSVEENLLRGLGITGGHLLTVPDARTGLVAVESGQADGLALSSPTVRWMAQSEQLTSAEMARDLEQTSQAELGYGAFAFRREDRLLLEAWNRELRPFVGSPEHLTLIARFGFTPAELP
ncbi:MAG: ectoine/hydroxyectoine ABC transporter substrate-binding protein EhuB [Pseudomonadota bacterium]